MADRLYPDATLFIQLIIFLLLLFVISRLVIKPVLNVIRERRKRTLGAREETLKLKEQIEGMLKDYNEKLSAARKENARNIEQMKKEGEELGKGIVEKAKKESEKSFADGKRKIWEEAENVEKKLEEKAQEFSDDLVSKILK